MFQKPVDEAEVKKVQKHMEKCLDEIQTIWLKNGEKRFILGDEISVADILACCELEQPSKILSVLMKTSKTNQLQTPKF